MPGGASSIRYDSAVGTPSTPPPTLLLTGASVLGRGDAEAVLRRQDRLGLLLMVASAAAFALMAALMKALLPKTPTQTVVLSRGIVMSLVFLGWALARKVPLVGRRPSRLLLRGLLGYGAISCYFASVQRLPVGEAVLLQYSHPVFVATIAPLLLRESTTIRHWILVFLAFGGLALVVGATGSFRGESLIGLSGALLSGLAYMTVRDLSRTEHPLTILLWFPLVTIPGALIATLRLGAAAWPQSGAEWWGHLAISATGLLGQLTLTEGLRRAGAARATAVTMAGPVFGILFGWWFFGTTPGLAASAGTVVVLSALALLAWWVPRRSDAPEPERQGPRRSRS